jgi:hypothetical protein
MIMESIRSALGPLVVVLDFFAENPNLFLGLMIMWMGVYLAGKIQLVQIESRSVDLLVRYARARAGKDLPASAEQLQREFLPVWREEQANWRRWFIPHRYDFWPVPATPENLITRIPLSPEWVHRKLAVNGIQVEKPPVARRYLTR